MLLNLRFHNTDFYDNQNPKNTNNSYKTYKKVPILIDLSTKTLIQNLFCSYIKSFETVENIKIVA